MKTEWWQDLASTAMCGSQNPVLVWISQFVKFNFSQNHEIQWYFIMNRGIRTYDWASTEMSQSNSPNWAQGHLGETKGGKKETRIVLFSHLECCVMFIIVMLLLCYSLTWNKIMLFSHLEWKLSVVGNISSNNPSLTSLKSQWQSWDWLQLLKK